MSICERDLIAHGEELASRATEVEWRASVGRSYYGAYHLAEAWHDALPTGGMATPGKGMHATLIECLRRPTVVGSAKLTSMSLGYVLEHMKKSRVDADYKLTSAIDRVTAANMVAHAQTIASKV